MSLPRSASAQVSPTDGGVGFSRPFALGYRVCLWDRIASRVLWQLAESEYRHEEEIYRLARNIDLAAPVLGARDHPRAGGRDPLI